MSKNKVIAGYVRMELPAGKATPGAKVGQALGQRGVNLMEFCKAFNAASSHQEPNTPTPVLITVYADKTFILNVKSSPVSYFVKQAAKLEKASSEPGKKVVASITKAQVRDIASKKIQDMNANDIESAMRMVVGTALSMGIIVKG